MRCYEVMKTDVASCWIQDPIADVASRMRSWNIGFMPVCNDAGEIVGAVTDRDLVVRAMADRLSDELPVHRVMTRSPITCRAFEDLARAEDLMRLYRKSRVVCVDESRRPIGVISLSDVADVEYPGRAGRIFHDVASRERRA